MCPMHKSGSFTLFPHPKKPYLKPWQYLPIHPWKQTRERLSILNFSCLPDGGSTVFVYRRNCFTFFNIGYLAEKLAIETALEGWEANNNGK